MNGCGHHWVYQGLVYEDGARRPGGGACDRVYIDRYYCNVCLEIRDLNKRTIGNSYQPVIKGALPA